MELFVSRPKDQIETGGWNEREKHIREEDHIGHKFTGKHIVEGSVKVDRLEDIDESDRHGIDSPMIEEEHEAEVGTEPRTRIRSSC